MLAHAQSPLSPSALSPGPLASHATLDASAVPGLDTRAYGFWREGDLLSVRSGSTLPKRCIQTGSAEAVLPSQLSIEWTPRWVFLATLFVPIFGIILWRAMRRRAELTVFASPKVRAQRESGQRLGKVLQWVPLLGFAAGATLVGAGVAVGVLIAILSILLASPFIGAGLWLVALNGLVPVERIVGDVVYVRVDGGFWAGLRTWQPGEHAIHAVSPNSPFA